MWKTKVLREGGDLQMEHQQYIIQLNNQMA